MQKNNTAIVVFLISILVLVLVLISILYSRITHTTDERPAGAWPVDNVAQQEAVGYMKTEIQELTAQLLREFPEDSYLMIIAAKFYKQCDDPHKVMAIMENGLKYNPENIELNKIASQVAFGTGQYEKAVFFGKKILAIDSKYPEIYENLADALIFSGEYLEAVEMIEKRIETFGDSARSYWLLGKGHLLLMNYEKAKECYEKAFKKDPYLKRTHATNMAKIHMKLKQPEEAKKYMKIHREIIAERKIKDVEDAKSKKYRIVMQSSGSELLAFSENLAELCVTGRKLYNDQKKLKEAQQVFDGSCSIFKKAIAIDPDNADMHREFATIYIATGIKLSKAERLAKKAVALEGSALNYYVLGHAYYKNSDKDKALLAFKKAFELDPDNMRYKQAYDSMKRTKIRQ